MRPTPSIISAVAATAVVLALVAPLHYLLLFDLLLAFLPGHTSVAGILMDPTDVILAVLLVALFLKSQGAFRMMARDTPLFWLWVLLGILMSITYLLAPGNQQHLTALHRAVYQVYRAAWKPILYFPLAALLLSKSARPQQALLAVIIAGDICALIALPEGLRGFRAEGPFRTGNSLGAVLIVPFIASFGNAFVARSWRAKVFYIGSSLLLARMLLFAGSRGAVAGVVAGLAVMLWFLFAQSKGRVRLLRLIPAGLMALLLLFALKPDLLNRPTVRRALTLTNPMEENTLQWRMEERWGFYWDRALTKPWIGHGSDIDPTIKLKGGAKTPHNGYLSLLVAYGFPAAILYLTFGVLGIVGGLRAYRRSSFTESSFQALLIAAGLTGILVHNLVDSLFTNVPYVNRVYWLLAALGATALGAMSGKTIPTEDPGAVDPEVTTVEKGPAA